MIECNMEFLVSNLVSTGAPRKAVRNGRQYLVVPATFIVPGVLNGSKGPLLYPTEEVCRDPHTWNGMPLTLDHPYDPITNEALGAEDEGVLDRQGIGFVDNVTGNGKLAGEAWFDVEACRRVDNRLIPKILKREPIELSTGLHTENETHDGTYNGTPYHMVARNYRPNHVAILLDGKGACAVEHGCGVHVANEDSLLTRITNAIKAIFNAPQPRHLDTGEFLHTGGKPAKKQLEKAAVKGFEATRTGAPSCDDTEPVDDDGRKQSALMRTTNAWSDEARKAAADARSKGKAAKEANKKGAGSGDAREAVKSGEDAAKYEAAGDDERADAYHAYAATMHGSARDKAIVKGDMKAAELHHDAAHAHELARHTAMKEQTGTGIKTMVSGKGMVEWDGKKSPMPSKESAEARTEDDRHQSRHTKNRFLSALMKITNAWSDEARAASKAARAASGGMNSGPSEHTLKDMDRSGKDRVKLHLAAAKEHESLVGHEDSEDSDEEHQNAAKLHRKAAKLLAAGKKTTNRRKTMLTREDLIANCECEDVRNELEALSEEAMTLVVNTASASGSGSVQGGGEEHDDEVVDPLKKKPKLNAKKTDDEDDEDDDDVENYLATVPEPVRQFLRNSLLGADTEKQRLVDRLSAGNKKLVPVYNKLEVSELRDLVTNQIVEVDSPFFDGATVENAGPVEDVLPLPTMNWKDHRKQA